MAYKKSELEQASIKAIEENNLIFFDEVASYLPCSKATFYNHKLEQLESIKSILDKNKDTMKVGLRKKWYESDNSTVQIALMRLICTDAERRNLALNYNEHSGMDGGALQIEITKTIIEKK